MIFFLASIKTIDLITVCLITVACVMTMVGIIVVSSRAPKKRREEDDVTFTIVPEELPEDRPILKEKKTNLEDVLSKIENELENGPKNKHTFEEEQEQKAIISYKELLKVAGKLKEENEIRPYEEELEEPINPKLQEVQSIKKQIEEKKFKSSEFISPVYGKQTVEEKSAQLENKKSSQEEKENDQFLSALKDLRKNLE